MTLFEKSTEQKPDLNLEQASKILANVFEANDVEPNSIPLEVLTSYSNYRKERFSLQRMIIVIILVLFFMLPFLFIPSDFVLQPDDVLDATNPTYTLEVTSPMLVKRINASIDGRNIPVYEMDSHIYSIEPMVNGRMTVTVTLMNNQVSTQYIEVNNVDLKAPVMISSEVDQKNVYLYLSDSGTGINYEDIEGVKGDGSIVKPISYDKKTGCVVFAYPEGSLNVMIPDFAENTLQLVLRIE